MKPYRREFRIGVSYGNSTTRRLISSVSRWRPLQELPDAEVATVRLGAFKPSLPALLPRASFCELPAVQKWFARSNKDSSPAALDYGYLEKFGTSIVPLELTRHTAMNSGNQTNDSFQRAEVPLQIFLDWTKIATMVTSERLYLAQASVSNLPKSLIDDIPTPEIAMAVGTGDVYDTNLWMGIAPTYTPLHRDPNPNLFVQLAGHKVVRILSPEMGDKIFRRVQSVLGKSGSAAFRGDEMMKGEEKQVLEAEIWNKADEKGGDEEEKGYEAHVWSGDGVFIPRGWWHSIKGVDSGILASVNWWFR